MESTLFFERQKFRQVLVWLILVPIDIFFVYAIYSQLIFTVPIGTKPMGDFALILSAILVFLVNILFVVMRLETIIKEDGIYYKFFPFHFVFRKIAWTQVQDVWIRTYSPIAEYGGWGPRSGPSGQAFNVRGSQGLQVVLTNGNKVLFGTQKPEEVNKVLETLNQFKKM